MPVLHFNGGPAAAQRLTAACIGTFVMVESGLLDHQRATTTWWLAPLFRKRYPKALLEESSMIVRSGRFITATERSPRTRRPFGPAFRSLGSRDLEPGVFAR